MAKYGYARCSTSENKQDLERQIRELSESGAERVFSEYITGVSENKPELDNLIQVINQGDILAVTEVSRLARSVHQLCHILELAQNKRICLKCGALTVDFTKGETNPMYNAMFYMIGVFAELERGVTVERIKSGIAHAKKKGVVSGRRAIRADDVPPGVLELVPAYNAGILSVSELARKTGLTRPSIYKYLKLLEVKTRNTSALTVTAVPEKIKANYEAYKAGELTVSEYARRADVSRTTIYKWVKVMDAGMQGV